MTSISWRNGPILRNGAIGTAQACCCQAGAQCCGIPNNCAVSVNVDGVPYTYDPQTALWVNDNNEVIPWSVGFGDCQDAQAGTGDPKYATCCLSASSSDTPAVGDCIDWTHIIYARLVCDTCCSINPSIGLNCRFEDPVSYTLVNGVVITAGQTSPCDAFIPTLSFSMTCQGNDCNEFP